MNTEQILKVLKNERECIKAVRTDECVKDCRTCRYYNTDPDRLEVYDFLINGYEMLQNEGAESYTIKCKEPLSEEQLDFFKEEYGKSTLTATIDFEPIKLPDNLKAVILGEKGDTE